jgi:SAF domain-containing protein
MSRAATTQSDTTAPAGPVPAPRVIRQRRFRTGALALAVLFIALGGLLAGFAYLATVRTQDVLAVTRAVPAGTQLAAADLAAVQINVTPGLAPIPANQLDRVVGKRAAVSLVPGTLLTDAHLTDRALVQPNQRQVGVGLKPERMPARTLRPGDRVQLVATPADNVAVTGNTAQTGPPEKFDATVVDASVNANPGTSGVVVVYLAVSELEAPRVVTLAAQGRITMVLTVTG